MSNFDNLATVIADELIRQVDENNSVNSEPDEIDATDTENTYIHATVDLRVAALAIAAGWVHADELNQLRAVVDRVQKLAYDPQTGADFGRSAIVVDAYQLQRALEGRV